MMRIIFLFFILLIGSLEATTQIAVLGDSLTKGHGLSPEDAFPAVLEELLKEKGYDVHVTNAGITGSTTSGGLERLQWVMKNHPKIVVLALGVNDGLRGRPVATIKENLNEMIVYAKEHGAKVVLAGMRLPPSYGQEYRDEYAALFPALAKEHQITLIPFLLEGVAGIRALNLADGIHPNEEGHKIMAKTVYIYVEPLL